MDILQNYKKNFKKNVVSTTKTIKKLKGSDLKEPLKKYWVLVNVMSEMKYRDAEAVQVVKLSDVQSKLEEFERKMKQLHILKEGVSEFGKGTKVRG